MTQLVTKKTIEKMGATLREGAGSKVSGFALKHMEKLGWVEGQGLGKNSDGRSTHIKTVKKDDKEGLGIAEPAAAAASAGEDQWWFDSFKSGMDSFK